MAQADMETTVHLKLDRKEALWLKSLLQNPLSGDPSPDNEPEDERRMRRKIFQSIPSEEKLTGSRY